VTVKENFTKSKKQPPKLRHHKATGQAYTVISGRAVYFGPFENTEANQKYHQTIAEWLAAGKNAHAPCHEITIDEVIARFWLHAEKYYVRNDGTPTSEVNNFRQALRPLKQLYGHTKVVEFGARAMCTVRQHMINNGWCRSNINKMVGRIKLMFRWAAAQELIPASIYHVLDTVSGLRHGRSEAKETEPVRPVQQEYIDAIEPYVSRQVWAIIQLQLLTAARSGELVMMRPCDIDMSDKIWLYRPAQHKTAHHGFNRMIYIGPLGQDILRPFLRRPANSYCFSPAELMAQHRLERAQQRTTPQKYGNGPGTNIKESHQRQPGKHYTPTGLGHAVAKAIKKAFRPEGMSDEKFSKWKPSQHWHPHQLRHNAATFLRKEFGLETARIILGHRSAAITEVYAEMDQQKAMEAIVRVG